MSLKRRQHERQHNRQHARESMKPKRCSACGESFEPSRAMQKACGLTCALALVEKRKVQIADRTAKEARRELREGREKAKTRGDHLRELQATFNAWIRLRDAALPCISCGRPASWDGQWDAGHYRSVGSSPATRFDPSNVAKQCLPCNRHLSGDLIRFRIGLINRIGLEEVERLEGPHEAKKLSVAELQEMKSFYRAEVRRLKRNAA